MEKQKYSDDEIRENDDTHYKIIKWVKRIFEKNYELDGLIEILMDITNSESYFVEYWERNQVNKIEVDHNNEKYFISLSGKDIETNKKSDSNIPCNFRLDMYNAPNILIDKFEKIYIDVANSFFNEFTPVSNTVTLPENDEDQKRHFFKSDKLIMSITTNYPMKLFSVNIQYNYGFGTGI